MANTVAAAVLAERLGHVVAVPGVEALDLVGDLAGLGQHLERDRLDRAFVGLGEDPHLVQTPSQITFRFSRKVTISA